MRTIDEHCGKPPGSFKEFVAFKEAFIKVQQKEQYTDHHTAPRRFFI